MKKLLNFYIPYLIFLLVIFNDILSNKGIKYLYVLFIIIGIIGMLLTGMRKISNSNIIYILLYFMGFIFIFIIQFFVYNDALRSMKSLFMYLTIPIYWVIYFNKFDIDDFKEILIKIIPWVYLVASFAYIQYFFSPDLFDLITITKAIKWASGSDANTYQRYFRAASILTSPQVFGLFMALSIIKIISLKKYSNIFGIIFLIFAGLLSGNKSFFIIMVLYFLYRIFIVKISGKFRLIFIVSGLIFIVIYSFSGNLSNIGAINRVIDLKEMKNQEKNQSRLDKYQKMFLNNRPIIGNGLGTKTDKNIKNYESAESYIFQISYEAGLFIFLFFWVFLFKSYQLASKKLLPDIKILIFSISFSMIVVHAMGSPVFFIFWGVLISSYSNEKDNYLKEVFK